MAASRTPTPIPANEIRRDLLLNCLSMSLVLVLSLQAVLAKQPPKSFFYIAFPAVAPVFVVWMLLKINRITRNSVDPNARLWLALIFIYIAVIIATSAAVFRLFGLKDGVSGAKVVDGFDCLYFSITTITTVGFGDFVPGSAGARFFAGYEALTGYFLLGLSIPIVINVSASKADDVSTLDLLNTQAKANTVMLQMLQELKNRVEAMLRPGEAPPAEPPGGKSGPPAGSTGE